jgi:hypothetical protein
VLLALATVVEGIVMLLPVVDTLLVALTPAALVALVTTKGAVFALYIVEP